MTNILPQTPDLNGGPWGRLETYCDQLVAEGNELYIIAGREPASLGTIDYGNIDIPEYWFKVVLVLPAGTNDLSRINASTRVIAVEMPNITGITNDAWQKYSVSADYLENMTGFDLF